MEEFKLFDAEYKFLDVIWEPEPVNSTELSKVCFEKLGWKKSTTYTMIRKLEKSFDNSLPSFPAAFLKDKRLTINEAEELKKMIEEATK
ncbi:BlaI/MecI/CopY family transcriptional regulator [Sedimentibacter sp.]|uniref:BlaI/MecI/CopY family transcriptional regulator n=1 Tax=Sedimentibacter sp. TaxID=1960295 RepID=UPI0028A2A7F2|nr:BlaI/MecI/CopY family transcriptional regulator [Sedimentibacter sp.]